MERMSLRTYKVNRNLKTKRFKESLGNKKCQNSCKNSPKSLNLDCFLSEAYKSRFEGTKK